MKRVCTLVSFLIALLVALPAFAQPTARQAPREYKDVKAVPDTPALRYAQQLVQLFQKGDLGAYKAFMQQNFAKSFLEAVPMAEHEEVFSDMARRGKSLEVFGARTYSPPDPDTRAVLVVRNTLMDSWQAIVVEVEEDPPHRIVGIDLAQARPPSDLPKAEKLTDAQIGEKLKAFVDRLAKLDEFSGTYLFAKDGKVLASGAVGVANRDFDAPVTLDTRFNLGSMNKMMTGVAVMQLVEQGKLTLDDPIAKYLSDDWIPKVDKSKVCIKHLLTHTSGLGSYFTDEWDRSSRGLYHSVDDWKAIVKGETLAFEPGTKWQYSNTGMLIAGAIVEKVSGLSYYDYVEKFITGPAGMTNSCFCSTDLVNKNLAVGYEKSINDGKAEYRNNLYQHVVRGGPAGGGYSTVEDLLKFGEALRSGKLLKTESRDQLWVAYPDLSSPEYGLGFGINQAPAGRIVGHNGGFPGISATLHMYLDSGHTVTVLSNYGQAAEFVDRKALELINQGR